MEDTWYESLRVLYRPDRVTLLLVAESAPDPAGGDRRFFYASTLASADNLFRGVIQGLYGHRFPPGSTGTSKVEWLKRLRRDGVYLIDVVPYPINKHPQRRQTLRDHARLAIERVRELSPKGIVVCHAPTFRAIGPLLRAANLPLLHDESLPFPLGNTRAEFAEKLRRIVDPLGLS